MLFMDSSYKFRLLKVTVPSIVSVLLVFMTIIPSLSSTSETTKTGSCEYDLDLSSKKVKIICQGSSSMINVYANSAHLTENEIYNENRHTESMNDKQTRGANRQNPNMPAGYSSGQTRPRNLFEPDSRGEPSERLTFQEPGGYYSVWEPDNVQGDRGEMGSSHDSAFAATVWNVREKLHTAKQNLSSCSASIRNISTQLSQGDFITRPDMDNLRRVNNSGPDLTDGIIEALRNQYNFMSSGLLSRSYELQKLAVAMMMLVDVTSDGLSSAVTAHSMMTDEVSQMKSLFGRLRRRVSKTINNIYSTRRRVFKNRKQDRCPKQISAIGAGTVKNMHWSTGSYMVEFTNSSRRGSVFIMAETGPTSQLLEYHTVKEVEYDLVGKNFTLPFSCYGTGHVVYRRHFYCHRAGTNLIVKYNLNQMKIKSELALPGAKFGNTLPYMSGANTDVDLAVDELGLWAIYATEASKGNIIITKINDTKMEINKNETWVTSFPKNQAGNAFFICGTMYATNSHNDTPTFIRYVYDTATSEGQRLEDGAVPFANFASLRLNDETPKINEERSANSVMLSYDLVDSELYSWNNGRLESFPVYFKERE